MAEIIICSARDSYHGVYQLNSLAEYLDDKKIGSDVEGFINRYVDEDSQTIKYSPYALYDAQSIAEKIGKRFEKQRVIVYCDSDEIIDDATMQFIGYDVCSDDNYTSPIGLQYFDTGIEQFYDEPFFDNLTPEVRDEYYCQLNSYGLFDSLDTAKEIAEYCNWLVEEYYDMFQGAENFKIVCVYK